MGSIQISQRTTTTVTVQQETRIQQTPAPAPVAPPPPAPSRLEEDVVDIKKPAQPDSVIGTTKKIFGGALIGGAAMSAANSAAKSMATNTLQAPSVPVALLGVGLGTGIGLLNIETGDQNINTLKNTAGGALIAGTTTAAVTAVVKTMGTEYMHGPTLGTAAIGAAFGAGIALANNKLEDEGLNKAKNVAAGVLIGGSALSAGMATIQSMASSSFVNAGWTSAGVGAAFGAGIALANMEAPTKEARLFKNLGAGALIGGSVGAAGSAVIKAMATESFRNPSWAGIAIGVAAGAGIALLNAED